MDLYSSTLQHLYQHAGQRVMLSIAYGSDKSSEATSVHRPEFCYSAQGFKVRNFGEAKLNIGTKQLQVQRLYALLGTASQRTHNLLDTA
ncbi:MAG: EpsI family protein [Burkholderiales bacterium]|nr:EpsI family protein [Burkholderiales bacterium]